MRVQYIFDENFSKENDYDESISLDIRLKHNIFDKDKDAIRDIMDTLAEIADHYREIRVAINGGKK